MNRLFSKIYIAENIVNDNNFIWYKTNYYNCLLCVSRTTGLAESVILPDEYKDNPMAFRRIVKSDNKLFLLPFRAREICIYNIETETFEVHRIPNNLCSDIEFGSFMAGTIIDDYLIMFGYHPIILVFKMSTGEMFEMTGFLEQIPQEERPKIWFESHCVVGDELFLLINGTNRLIVLNPQKKQVRTQVFGKENKKEFMDGLFFDGEVIWTIPRIEKENVSICSWNPQTHEIRDYHLKDVKYHGLFSFSRIGIGSEKLFLLPAKQGEGYVYDLITCENHKMEDLPTVPIQILEDIQKGYPLNYLGSVQTEDNHLLAIHCWTRSLVDIDASTGKLTKQRIFFSDNSLEKIYNSVYKNTNAVMETLEFGLAELMEMIVAR